MQPEVKRGLPPLTKDGLVLYCEDSPERPGYEPQDGDTSYSLTFPLYDGTTLILKAGKECYAHFVAMLSAAAADDADEELQK